MSYILIKGVAKAFSCQVEHNEDLVKLCKSWFKKDDINDPCFKLAQVPSKGILNRAHDKKTGKPMLYPIVSVENVFVFPGMLYHTQYTSETYLLNFLFLLQVYQNCSNELLQTWQTCSSSRMKKSSTRNSSLNLMKFHWQLLWTKLWTPIHRSPLVPIQHGLTSITKQRCVFENLQYCS